MGGGASLQAGPRAFLEVPEGLRHYGILLASVGLGFANEYKAAKAAEALHSAIRHRCGKGIRTRWT